MIQKTDDYSNSATGKFSHIVKQFTDTNGTIGMMRFKASGKQKGNLGILKTKK